jgi:hypothetical protein
VPAEAKVKVEGANAFFIIPALSGNTIMELFPPTHLLKNGLQVLRL